MSASQLVSARNSYKCLVYFSNELLTFNQNSSYSAQAIMHLSNSTITRSCEPFSISKSRYSFQFFSCPFSNGFTWKYGRRICNKKMGQFRNNGVAMLPLVHVVFVGLSRLYSSSPRSETLAYTTIDHHRIT